MRQQNKVVQMAAEKGPEKESEQMNEKGAKESEE